MIKCVRCNGTGKVRKYLLGCCSCYELIAILIAFIIGGIIGIISYILLIKKLLFNCFGTIFYFLGALSIFSIISHNSFANVLKEKEILFKNITDSPLVLILIIVLSYLNTKLGNYLILSDKILINLINIIYCILQGTCTVYMILIIEELISLKTQIECPLCEGNKFIEEIIFRNMERCKICTDDVGYDRICTPRRGFCESCKGIGYKFKNY
mgnify:CR=1 FL=1